MSMKWNFCNTDGGVGAHKTKKVGKHNLIDAGSARIGIQINFKKVSVHSKYKYRRK